MSKELKIDIKVNSDLKGLNSTKKGLNELSKESSKASLKAF